MKPFNIMMVVFLVLLIVFVISSLERMKLQDSRIRRLEDRLEAVEKDLIQDVHGIDLRPELRHAL